MAIELELLECNCFDLVGNRRHQLFLVECIEALISKRGINRRNWTANQCVQFLRNLNELDTRVFPYQFIRAVDLFRHMSIKTQYVLRFLEEKENYTIINPKIVICAFAKEALNLQSKRIVYSSSKLDL